MPLQFNAKNVVAAKLYDFYIKNIKAASDNKQKQSISKTFKDVFHIQNSKSKHLAEFISKLDVLTNKIDCTDYTLRRAGTVEETPQQTIQRQRQDGSNKIKGDLFEVFTYVYMQCFGAVSGIFDCEFSSYDEVGYDFIAANHAKNPCVIQSKFVANGGIVFGADIDGNRLGSLETFFSNLPEGFVIQPKQTSRVLITTARRVHSYYSNLARKDKTFEIHDYKKLATRTNNDGFWAVLARYSDNFFVSIK